MKWRLQFMLLVMLSTSLIISGIHLAEKGTRRIDGLTDAPSQSFSIIRADQGKLEMTVLGRQYSVNAEGMSILSAGAEADDESDTEQADGSLPPNWFSLIGNYIGNWITAATRGLMEWIEKYS